MHRDGDKLIFTPEEVGLIGMDSPADILAAQSILGLVRSRIQANNNEINNIQTSSAFNVDRGRVGDIYSQNSLLQQTARQLTNIIVNREVDKIDQDWQIHIDPLT